MAISDSVSGISGIVSRYRADQITGLTNGASVTTWPDASANAYDATGVTGKQPTYVASGIGGKPSVAFAAQYFTTGGPAGTATQTVIAVVQWSGGGTVTVRGPSANGGLQYRLLTGKQNNLAAGVADLGSSTSALTTSAATLIATTYDAAVGSTWYKNGAADGTSTTKTTLATSTANIGGSVSGNEGWAGQISEVITWNRVLTASELATVGSYVQSFYGITVSGTTPDTTAPTVPGTPTATAGAASASVAFAASTDDTAVTGYQVFSSADSYAAAVATGTTSPINVTGLTNGTAYTFKVRAYDAAGNYSTQSPASNSVTPAAAANTAPGAPTGLTATAGSSQVALSWTAPSSNGGAAITDYQVQYSSNSGSTWTTVTRTASTTTSQVVSGLTNSTAYQFRVAAINSVGTGSYSSTASATPAASNTIAANDANIVYSPFVWDVSAARAGTINPGAYLRFAVLNATAITLNFDMSGVSTPVPRIKIRVDDGPTQMFDVAATISLAIPTTNTWATHFVEVVVAATSEFVNRWTPQNAIVKFTSATCTGSNVATRPIGQATKNVLIYGDSITEGFKNLKDGTDPSGSDAEVAWSFLQRRLLGVEVGVVGFGAQGWVNGGQGGVPALPASYNLLWSGVSRSFTAPVPDVVVINMGTNDSSDITSLYTSFLNTILALNSTTKVAAMLPYSGAHATHIQAAIAACTTPSRVTYVDTTGWFTTTDSYDGLHPYGIASQMTLGPRLANALRPLLVGAAATVTPKRYVNVGGVAKAIA